MKISPIPSGLLKRIDFYVNLINLVKERSTCRPDRKAGAIIIDKDFRVVSMGYNGSPPKLPHCKDEGCMIYNGHCIGTLHAEMNALANLKVKEDKLIMICNLEPCLYCLKMLLAFKMYKVIYLESYKDPARDFFLSQSGNKIEDAGYHNIQLRDRWFIPEDTEIIRLINHYQGPLFKEEY